MGSLKHIAGCVRRYALIIIGFGLYCAMLRQPFFGSVLALELADVHSIRGVLDGSIVVMAVVVLIAGIGPFVSNATGQTGELDQTSKQVKENSSIGSNQLASPFLPNTEESSISWRALPWSAAALLVLGICLLAVCRYSNLVPEWTAFGGAFFCACGFVLFSVLWIRLLTIVPDEDLLPVAMIAFTVSLLIGFADFVHGPGTDLINVLVPFMSAVCAIQCPEQLKRSDAETSSPGSSSTHIIMLAAIAIVVEVFCCSLVRGTWSSGGVGYGGASFLKLVSYLVSVGYGLVFLALSAYARQLEKSAVLISVISLVMVIALIVVVSTVGDRGVGAFVTSQYSALLVVLFAILVSATQRGFISPLVAAGAFSFVFACISFANYTLIPNLFAYDLEQSSAFVLPVALAATSVFAIGVCAILALRLRAQVRTIRDVRGEAALDDVWDGIALRPIVVEHPVYISPEEALDLSVERAANRFQLTEREAEIVRLFAQGRTIKQAASELYLAPSTVQGYTKSIYAKLGVRGKDEIRDLLNGLIQ